MKSDILIISKLIYFVTFISIVQQAILLKSSLKYNTDTDIKCILEKGEEAVQYRKQDLQQFNKDKTVSNILEEWPSFNQSYGYKLVIFYHEFFPSFTSMI